jgi:hypothetical protein
VVVTGKSCRRGWVHNVDKPAPGAASTALTAARRLIVLSVVVATACVSIGVLGATAASATISPTPEPSLTDSGATTTPLPTAPIVNVSGNQALWFIGIVAGAVALLWFSLLFFDLRSSNRWRQEHHRKLLEKMIEARQKDDGLTPDEFRQLVSAIDRPPQGSSGLTRSLLALTIVTLVGVALVATLVSSGAESIEQRKIIITSLLSITATISGFYFGARTAQTSNEQAAKPSTASRGPAGPSGAAGAAGAAGPAGPAAPAGNGAATDEVAVPPEEQDEPEPTILPNPAGDDEGQVQDDDTEPLPDAPERDHR